MRWEHKKMRARVDHEVLPLAVERVFHLGESRQRSRELDGTKLLHVLDLLHSLRADGERVRTDREQDHVFPVAAPLALFFFEEPHSAPTLLAPNTYSTRFSTAVKMLSMPSTWSTAPVLMASCGMPKMIDVASSCATT